MLPEVRRRGWVVVHNMKRLGDRRLYRLRHDSTFRRRVFLGTTGAAVIIVVLVTGKYSEVVWWSSPAVVSTGSGHVVRGA